LSLPDSKTFVPGVFGLEYCVQLFQCKTFRLDEKEVHKSRLERVPKHKEYVEPVTDLFSLSLASPNLADPRSKEPRRRVTEAVDGQLTLESAIGPTNVLRNPAAPAVSLKVPMHLARILLLTTSAG